MALHYSVQLLCVSPTCLRRFVTYSCPFNHKSGIRVFVNIYSLFVLSFNTFCKHETCQIQLKWPHNELFWSSYIYILKFWHRNEPPHQIHEWYVLLLSMYLYIKSLHSVWKYLISTPASNSDTTHQILSPSLLQTRTPCSEPLHPVSNASNLFWALTPWSSYWQQKYYL